LINDLFIVLKTEINARGVAGTAQKRRRKIVLFVGKEKENETLEENTRRKCRIRWGDECGGKHSRKGVHEMDDAARR